jgi:hypothetical protein
VLQALRSKLPLLRRKKTVDSREKAQYCFRDSWFCVLPPRHHEPHNFVFAATIPVHERTS